MAAPTSSNVKHTCTQLTEGFRSEFVLKMIDPINVTKNTIGNRCLGIRSRCSVHGYVWEICLYPCYDPNDNRNSSSRAVLALDLVLVGKTRTAGSITANLSGKIVNSAGGCYISPYQTEQKNVPKEFCRLLDRSNPFYIGTYNSGGVPWKFSLTVECAITVFISGPEANGALPVPPSDLSRHYGELLRSQAGADVTFSVSGESFQAHKCVLAIRSPIFMVQFFGEMKEKDVKVVEIMEIDADVFKAILHFIYTDEVPELDEKPEAEAMALAQHLIVAADMYGLERLKVMCERRLALHMDVSTVAATLALAEQRNCSRLKAKCIEFITGGSQEILSAVLATDGYKHMVEKNPSMMTELLKAAHGRKRS